MHKLKKFLIVLVNVLLWGVILLAALFSFTTLATKNDGKLANIAGFTPLTVLSNSMYPEFSEGDLIIIKKTNLENLKQGDIVSFYTIIENEYALNTHRILEINEQNGQRSYVTKGDNNDLQDKHIIADGDIVGKYVTKIPLMGNIMQFLASSVGFLVVIILPMLLFLIYQIYNLITVAIAMKKQNSVEIAKANDTELQRLQAEAQAALAEAERLKEQARATLAKAEENAKPQDK